MNTDEIPDEAMVAIEYGIPRTKNRIDFMVIGSDDNHKDKVVVIELKQWSEIEKSGKDAIVSTRFQHGQVETVHPSYQAWSYTTLLHNFNEVVYTENIDLVPCAYLHNHQDSGTVTDFFYQNHIEKAPLFCKGDKEKLQHFISRFVKYGGKKDLLYRIDSGNVRPSKELADNLLSMMQGNSEFILIDDQKIVFEMARHLMMKSNDDQKQVFIVEGGPGTGKSVVAINLLVSAIQNQLNAQYVTKNAAPRAVFEAKLSGSMKKSQISNLFQSSSVFINSKRNEFDVLIVDAESIA
jgi:hypothetical protein